MSKQKQTLFKTPRGIGLYPWLNNPDTQFDSAGQYKVDLRMKKEDAKPLVDAVKKAVNDEFGDKAKSAVLPFKTDPDTGDIIVKTKSKYPPRICDSRGMKLAEQHIPQIYAGSELILGGQMYLYRAGGNIGCSMQLGAVQIIELADAASGTGMSFEPVEGGFVVDVEADNDNEEQGDAYNF